MEVENNSLSTVVKACEKALETCVKNTTCRAGMNQMGVSIGLTNAQIEEAMKAGATRNPAIIAKLTPEQINYLDTQIRSGAGMAGLILGKLTWGDRLNLPSNTGGDQIADSGPTNTGGNQTASANVPNHTGNNQSTVQESIDTRNTDDAPDTGGNTTVTPIPEAPGKDDLAYLALKGKEAQEAAGKLGFDRRISAPKAPFISHGQPVFFNGKTYITPDVDSHNVTNGWKMFDRKGNRMGTYDGDLNRIKD